MACQQINVYRLHASGEFLSGFSMRNRKKVSGISSLTEVTPHIPIAQQPLPSHLESQGHQSLLAFSTAFGLQSF
ncbi:MAG: hypothetical protein ACI9EW_001120 [Cellvibrionaceae bacterium]|jgi:hypothetical protein